MERYNTDTTKVTERKYYEVKLLLNNYQRTEYELKSISDFIQI
jgi:hypothetical protein